MKYMNTILTALYLTMVVSGMLLVIALILGGVYKRGYDKGVEVSNPPVSLKMVKGVLYPIQAMPGHYNFDFSITPVTINGVEYWISTEDSDVLGQCYRNGYSIGYEQGVLDARAGFEKYKN